MDSISSCQNQIANLPLKFYYFLSHNPIKLPLCFPNGSVINPTYTPPAFVHSLPQEMPVNANSFSYTIVINDEHIQYAALNLSAMDESSGWANLHPDLLRKIAKLMYSYDDYIRLRCICKQWNSFIPWLVLPFDHTFDTHCLEARQICHVRVPEIKDIFIRGSSHGYVITVTISDGTLRIIDPFIKSQFDLPPTSTFPDIVSYDEYTIVEHIFDGSQHYSQTRLKVHATTIDKIITSSPPSDKDFMAVCIYGLNNRLAYCP
ncbi:hypothetical protein PIB30_033667 [Stylosanthes scabra]|uniref:KIB1-4 beta-propeller domain-containing protein n=1 Tax=Stylosanthes scabra TaxID=79078 RepID=A0ABU6UBB6_9FABA|nr:hypothetical protein [Stylosanthes scabra]